MQCALPPSDAEYGSRRANYLGTAKEQARLLSIIGGYTHNQTLFFRFPATLEV